MKPIDHRLQEGGLGEVVAAEMMQGVADAQRAAVAHLQADHTPDWVGRPEHDDPRWARAVAHIEIMELDDSRPISEVPIRIHFSHGFAEPPKITGGERPLHPGSNPTSGWFMDWKLTEPGPQSAMLGYRVRSSGVALPSPRVVCDVGAHPGSDIRRADDDGRGWACIGAYTTVIDGEQEHKVVGDELRNISYITLLIR